MWTEINTLLPLTKGQIGDVAACHVRGITDRNEIVAEGAAANTGAVSNIESNITAIRDGEVPVAPSQARLSKHAAGSFLKQHRSGLTHEAIRHVEDVIARSDWAASDSAASEEETAAVARKGDELEQSLDAEGGVYVYTYPHYWRHPTAEGTKRTMLKVGYTAKNAEQRVRDQARGTHVPEKPLMLRVYRSAEHSPQQLERKFHRLLKAADHERGEEVANKERFETSTEFLDTVANEMGVEIVDQADEDEAS